jgi:hypothetical protein
LDVRARRTDVRLRVDFAAVRAVVFFFAAAVLLVRLVAARRAVVPLAAGRLFALVRFAVLRLADLVLVRRVVERTDPLVFLRDVAAFNCFPLSGVCGPGF